MADRELSFADLVQALAAHGCEVSFNPKTQYIHVYRGAGPDHHWWKQHAHSGRKDRFDRRVVATARRRLGLASLSDAEFYAPLE